MELYLNSINEELYTYSIHIVCVCVLLFSCNNRAKENYICSDKDICRRIFIENLSKDSIEVFTKEFNSPNSLYLISFSGLDSFRCLSVEEIINSENLLNNKAKILKAFLQTYGDTVNYSGINGHLIYGRFLRLHLIDYRRQYFGVKDKKGKKKILLIMFDSINSTLPRMFENWNSCKMIGRGTHMEGYSAYFYSFLLDLDDESISIIPW